MSYKIDLAKAADWLLDIRNDDFGWGLTTASPSSLVNTSEALFVLRHAGKLNECAGGFEYLISNADRHRSHLGPRIRYTAFAIAGVAGIYLPGIEGFLESQRAWLLSARNGDGGWGHLADDNASHLLPTYLAMSALRSINSDDPELDRTYHWIISRFGQDGWSFSDGRPNSVATAYALLCLAHSRFTLNGAVLRGQAILLNTTHWGNYEESIPGTVWKHSTFPWIISALMELGHSPFLPVIAEGIRYTNTLRNPEGGWNEEVGHDARTVRAQYWAVFAMESVKRAFDPENDVPKVDADRTAEALTEPNFVRLLVHTRYATVVPAPLYRGVTYGLAALAVLCLCGGERWFGALPRRADGAIAALIAAGAFQLTRKRQRYFPRIIMSAANIIFGGLVLLNLITGLSLAAQFALARHWVWDAVQWIHNLA